MNRQYAEQKIREALALSDMNPIQAQRQVAVWAAGDMRLLLELAGPHLSGIVGHAVNRVLRQEERAKEENVVPAIPESLAMPPETFGQEIMKALKSSDTALFGQEGAAPPVARKQASQSHIDALRRMARDTNKRD